MKKFHTVLSFALLLASLGMPVHAQAPDATSQQQPAPAMSQPAPAPSAPAVTPAPSATPNNVKDIERAPERMSEQTKPPKVRRQAKSKQSTQPETVTR